MASSKSRSTPSNKNCLIGAKLAIENAEHHYQCAIHLHDVGEFGFAQSHFVLGVEEAIKSVFLLIKGLGFPFPQGKLRSILFRHKPRHEIGGVSHVMLTFIMWTVNLYKIGLDGAIDKTDAEIKQIRDEITQKILTDLQIPLNSDNSDSKIDQMIMPILNWWGNADEMKQKGLYVDFKYGNWSSPQQVKDEDYSRSLRIARDVIDNIKKGLQVVDSLSSTERKKMASELKQQLKRTVKSSKSRKGS